MRIIRKVNQDEVWTHWKKVENFNNDNFRSDIRDPLPLDLNWYLSILESTDINKIYVISSDDWKNEFLCVPDFKLLTALSNYKLFNYNIGKYKNICEKEALFKNDKNVLDKKFIIVAPKQDGPFTVIEGNKRMIALANLGVLSDIEVFLGLSSRINDYKWARYSKN